MFERVCSRTLYRSTGGKFDDELLVDLLLKSHSASRNKNQQPELPLYDILYSQVRELDKKMIFLVISKHFKVILRTINLACGAFDPLFVDLQQFPEKLSQRLSRRGRKRTSADLQGHSASVSYGTWSIDQRLRLSRIELSSGVE